MYNVYRLLLSVALVCLSHMALWSQVTFKAYLSGSHEVYPAVSAGFGEVTAQLSGNQLEVSGFFFNLAGLIATPPNQTAYLHSGMAGQNGSIELALNVTNGTDLRSGGFDIPLNTFFLSPEQVETLSRRGFYVNIRTTQYPEGELRGQLLPASDYYFSTNLLGSNVVPAVMSSGFGAMAFELLGTQLTVSGSLDHLEGVFDASTSGSIQLNLGLPGEVGSVQLDLNAVQGTDMHSAVLQAADNVFMLNAEQVEALLANKIYVNVSSSLHLDGELRGQVSNSRYAVFRAHFSGANERPFVTTGASGVVMAQLFGDTLLVCGSFSNLEGELIADASGDAHIHNGLAGQIGGSTFDLTPTVGPDQKSGIFELSNNKFALTPQQKLRLLSRGFYINIHSTAYPNGEIRGQVLPEAQYVYSGYMTGMFETAPVLTRASGAIKAELLGNKLIVSGRFSNLGSDFDPTFAGGAHLQIGMAGENGSLVFPLTVNTDADLRGGNLPAELNVFTLDSIQIERLKERRFYINIYTINQPAGEIRSQLLGEASLYFVAPLSGEGQAPAIDSRASGMAIVEVNGAKANMFGSFGNLSSDIAPVAGAARLQTGLSGQNGSVLFDVAVVPAPDNRSGSFEANANMYDWGVQDFFALRNRQLYLNVTTTQFPSGEIRGQLMPLSLGYFTATMAGINEVPTRANSGSGALSMEFNGNMLIASGSFAGLGSVFNPALSGGAHLHTGLPGQNGGIAISLTANPSTDQLSGTFAAADNAFILSPAQIEALFAGQYYANIHTAQAPGGEIRGQVWPFINYFPAEAPSIILPANGTALQLEGLPNSAFEVEWTASDDANTTPIYIWQASTSADFSTLLFQTNVGSNTSFVTTYSAIDNLLESNDIDVGSTLTLYHRAVATDGSLAVYGSTATLTLTRGSVALVQQFRAKLTGHNEALPVLTLGSGEITAVLTNEELVISGAFTRLTGNLNAAVNGGAHIHIGYAGQNGPIVFPLVITADPNDRGGVLEPGNNTFTLTPDQIEAISQRQWYINIHSDFAPGGEIRGQLLPAAEQYYTANLFGSNEVPSLITNATGALVIEQSGDQIVISGSFDNLTGDFAADASGGAHLHLGYAGQNGGIEIPLSATVDADLKGGFFDANQNTFTLTPEQLEALDARRLYANIHSTTAANGEIRGQVTTIPQALFRAHVAGSNIPGIVTSNADGTLLVELGNDSLIIVTGAFAGLESNVVSSPNGFAFVQLGLAGQNGVVQFPLNAVVDANNRGGVLAVENNTFVLTPAQRTALLSRAVYVNIRTEGFPTGEIRGQLLPQCQYVFTGALTGASEALPALTNASGAIKAEWLGNKLTLSGSYRGLGSPLATEINNGADLSLGFAGQNGPLLYALNPTPAGGNGQNGIFVAAENTLTLSTEQINQLRARTFYINIRSFNLTEGEIRSQLMGEANAYFLCPLSGASEALPVRTDATGMLVLEVYRGRGTLSGSFAGLLSNIATNLGGGARLYYGLAGQAGPVIRPLNINAAPDNRSGTFRPGNNTFGISPGLFDTLRTRAIYINVHSINNPGGEIRGQLMPVANAYFAANLTGFNVVQPHYSSGEGALKMELRGTSLTVTGSFAGMLDAYHPDNLRLHTGLAGAVGPADITLTPTSVNATDALIQATNNSFELTTAQMQALFSNNYYCNIPSNTYPDGELRGQVLHEINFFPDDGAAITSPANGTQLTIEGSAATIFETHWTAANDRDPLAYIWQVSLQEDFSTDLLRINVGDDLFYLMDYGTLNFFLSVYWGVPEGGSIQLWHRVLASDGSLATPGQRASITLTRGVVTDVSQPTVLGIRAKLFPTITQDELSLQVDSDKKMDAQVLVMSMDGKVMSQQNWELNPGEQTLKLDAGEWGAGAYFVTIQLPDGNRMSYKFIVIK